MKKLRFKQCPSCKFWVEKIAGCKRMICRCSGYFCYYCNFFNFYFLGGF